MGFWRCGALNQMLRAVAARHRPAARGRTHNRQLRPLARTNDAQRAAVRLARSGMTLQVPADRSVSEVLEDAGVCVPLACEQGICGTCFTGVTDGEPEHLESFLTAQERARNDQFTPCCSRSRSACLVLDR